MQHECHRCGAVVEDGAPFCRQCNAPQIKVAATAPSVQLDEIRSNVESFSLSARPVQPARAHPIDWRNALPSVFFVAIPAGLLSFPFNLLFFFWTFGAGALSVSSYRKRTGTVVTTGMAVRLGFLSGAVAFGVALFIFLIAMSRPEFGPPLRKQLQAQIQSRVASNPDPAVRQAAAMLTSPDGFATVLTFSIALLGAFFVLFSVLGAVAGATVFAPKNRAP